MGFGRERAARVRVLAPGRGKRRWFQTIGFNCRTHITYLAQGRYHKGIQHFASYTEGNAVLRGRASELPAVLWRSYKVCMQCGRVSALLFHDLKSVYVFILPQSVAGMFHYETNDDKTARHLQHVNYLRSKGKVF